jgi:hypothetical protein
LDTKVVRNESNGEAEFLAEFVRKHRFEHNEALPKVMKEYRQNRGKSPRGSCLVLVHAPFPAEDTRRDKPSGQACGKSDLLLRIKEELEQDENCQVMAFAGARKRQETWTFFDDLVNRLLEKENKPVRWVRFRHLLSSVARRISIFCSYAPWPLATIASLTLIVNTLKYWLDPHNKGIVGPIAVWFQHNDGVVVAVSAAAVIIFFAYTYGLILRAKEASWNDSWQIPSTKAIRDQRLGIMRSEPERLFQPFISSKKTLVLLLDDVDFLDAQNFQAFLELYEKAEAQEGMSIFAVLAYNPRNPRLQMAENSGIRNQLEDPEVLRHAIELEPLTLRDVKGFLWGYYNDQLAERAATIIYQSFQEAASNPGLILSYFEKNDENREHGDRKIPDLSPDEIRADFQQFFMHDQKIATDVVAAIKQHENGEECLKFLKYLLAFKSDRVSNEQFRTVTGISAESFSRSVRLLETGHIGILKLTTTDRPGVLEFREPYLRALLEANWREWEPGFYYTEVFTALHQKTKEKDKPEIALGAEPSLLAIDVLWREGEYYYNYFGKSDAGYALRYYGLGGGGALQKWLKLCESTQDEELWELIRWKSDARNNPYANTTRKQYPVYSFAPDLVLTTARLYWMSGESSKAERILAQDWQTVKRRLPQTEDRELAKNLKAANTRMQIALAEMRFRRGSKDDWETAAEVCAEIRRHEKPTPGSDPVSFHKATALGALITHYQEVGVRNLIWPERFVRTRSDLDRLRQASEEIPEQRLDRLGILQTLTDSSWEILYPWRSGPPLDLKLDALPAMNFEGGVVEEFERALGEQMNNLRGWAEQRQRSKEKVRPGARVDEADLLFHEGIFLFQRARHYCLRTYLDLKQDEDLLKSKTMTKAQARHDCYHAAAYRISQFFTGSLLTDGAPEGVGVELQEIEQLRENRLTVDRGRRAVAALERMFRKGWESIVKQADAKLRMAETIYRRLGSMPGMSAVAFAKALLSFEFPANDASRLDWVENTERFLYRSKGQLGWQLDALRARLLLAFWSETIDVPRATAEYEAAEQWTRPERLGLPQALRAEINLKIAELSAMPQFPLRTSEELIDRLRVSQETYERIEGGAPYISREDVRTHLLNIHWWLAELHTRLGGRADGPAAKQNQQQAVEHCTQVLKLAKGHQQAGYWEGITRLPLGRTLSSQGRYREALEQFDLGQQYFAKEGKDEIQQLQALVAMVTVMRSHTSEEREQENKRMEERFVDVFTIASRKLDEVSRIDATGKFILQRACKLIGDILSHQEAAGTEETLNPLFWYGKCFDLLMSLGLPAQAILLDENMRPLYMRTNDGLGLVTHHARLFQAARKLDARREKIPRSVSRILKEGTELKAERQSEQAGTKREYRQSAAAHLSRDPADLESAVAELEKARRLIDRDHFDDIDAEILDDLRICYRRLGDEDRAAAAEEQQQTVDSTIQSRDFYLLFEHYRRTGGDCVWALEMAVNVEVPNQYSRQAAQKREHFGEEPEETTLTIAMGGRAS